MEEVPLKGLDYGLANKRKRDYWEEWCTWRRVVDQEQSLGDTRMCTRRTGRFHLTRKRQDDSYDLNQLRTEPSIPNQDERRVIKMSWSIMPKAAERSSRQRHDTFCDPTALTRWSWMYTRSSAIAEGPRDAPWQLTPKHRAKCRTNVRRIAFYMNFKVIQGHWKWHE